MKEIWRTIKNHPDYEVSSKGNFRHKGTNDILPLGTTHHGYKYVMLDCEQEHAHRMVAKAFIPNTKNKPQVNHINHVRDDNRIENLEWVTFSENIKKAWEAKRFANVIGENHYSTSLTESDVRDIRERLENGETGVSIAERYDICSATVTGIKNGRVWAHVDT